MSAVEGREDLPICSVLYTISCKSRKLTYPWLRRVEVNAFDPLTAGEELALYIEVRPGTHSVDLYSDVLIPSRQASLRRLALFHATQGSAAVSSFVRRWLAQIEYVSFQ